ncbi:MAG: ASCH domain-containing protein [Deltaproteobacteria bacterium]|nr:ASCH domain-containing protein [Deltaproteobacteria bacterium]
MLFFVKKPFCDQIKAGLKTIEIRAGKRYQNIGIGDKQSINGHFYVKVTSRRVFKTKTALFNFLKIRHKKAGFPSLAAAKRACSELYPDATGPYFAFYISMG